MIAVALFDFTGEEDNSLSFKKGDAIEVLNKDNSGWWDGSCHGRRGW
jgi:son of sevenless-like protein